MGMTISHGALGRILEVSEVPCLTRGLPRPKSPRTRGVRKARRARKARETRKDPNLPKEPSVPRNLQDPRALLVNQEALATLLSSEARSILVPFSRREDRNPTRPRFEYPLLPRIPIQYPHPQVQALHLSR